MADVAGAQSDYLLNSIEEESQNIFEKMRNAPNYLTGDQIAAYVNAEIIIRKMNGNRAKSALQAIIDLYRAIVLPVYFAGNMR